MWSNISKSIYLCRIMNKQINKIIWLLHHILDFDCAFSFEDKCETRVKFEFQTFKINRNRNRNKTKIQMKTKKNRKKEKMNSHLGYGLRFWPISAVPASPTRADMRAHLAGDLLTWALCHTRFWKVNRMRTMYVPGSELTYTAVT
jgi:hypothetical protein